MLYSEARDSHAAEKIEKVYKNIWKPIRINYRVKRRDFPGNYVICNPKNRKLASARPSSSSEWLREKEESVKRAQKKMEEEYARCQKEMEAEVREAKEN